MHGPTFEAGLASPPDRSSKPAVVPELAAQGVRKMKKFDESKRLVIAILAAKENLTDAERTEAVKDLLADGLTIADITELVPRLLAPSRATPARTSSGQLPTVRTIRRLSQGCDHTT